MFDPDADGRDPTVRRFLRGREFPSTRCFLGLEDRDPIQEESLEALILIQAAARWQGLARQLCQALIRRFAFSGVAHEAQVTRLLATVILLLRCGICRAVDRTCGAIMPKWGWWPSRPSRAFRTSRQTLQLFGPEAALGLLRPDSTPDAARESIYAHAIGSSQRAVLAFLDWDAVSSRSE